MLAQQLFGAGWCRGVRAGWWEWVASAEALPNVLDAAESRLAVCPGRSLGVVDFDVQPLVSSLVLASVQDEVSKLMMEKGCGVVDLKPQRDGEGARLRHGQLGDLRP